MDWLRGVQYSVVTSRWFPLALALSMSVLHVGLLGFDYWAAARNEKDLDISRFLQRDLERPLFEPYGFCGAWTHYSAGQSADLGLNFPAYIGAILLHSAVNFTTCVDALTTPRGHIVTTVFVPPLWFMVGLSIGRIVHLGAIRGKARAVAIQIVIGRSGHAFAAPRRQLTSTVRLVASKADRVLDSKVKNLRHSEGMTRYLHRYGRLKFRRGRLVLLAAGL
jgi:hypothetical protein